MALRNQPYIPLYVQDFLTDEKLNECSAESVGVYIKIMCVMHKSDEYGTILLKQKDKQNSEQIINFALKLVKHLPFSFDVILNSLKELISEGILILDGEKLIQKRMVKDNNISIIRSKSGKKGGLKSSFAKANNEPKKKANSEYENEIENEIEIEYVDIFKKWINYKKSRKEKYKTKESLLMAYNKLFKISEGDISKAIDIIEDAMANNYSGFFALKGNKTAKKESKSDIIIRNTEELLNSCDE